MMKGEYVWVWDIDSNPRRYLAELLNLGAHYSMVKYTRGGIDYEVLVSNDDIIFGESDDNDNTED